MSAIGPERHSTRADECPLSGVKRTYRFALQMSAYDPKQTSTAPRPLLAGPFQMVAMETDGDIIATSRHVRRDEECAKKPAPCPDEFSKDPQRSHNETSKKCKHRTKRHDIQQKVHCNGLPTALAAWGLLAVRQLPQTWPSAKFLITASNASAVEKVQFCGTYVHGSAISL